MKLKTSALLIAGALFGAATLPAQANNDAMMDLLKVLRDKGTISSEDYNLLTNAAAAEKEMSEAEKAEMMKEVETATADMPKFTTKGKIIIEDREGNWSFQPIGRVMVDGVDVDNDGLENFGGFGDDEGSGTELRRARLGFQGKIYDWSYKFEADFAGGDASIKDANVGYGNSLGDDAKWGFKLGQSHIAFGYNTKASSKYMSFIDRPFFGDSAISPARESGITGQINASDFRWLLAASATRGAISDGQTNSDDKDTFAVRGSFVPFMQDEQHMVQIGAGYLTAGNGDDTFGFSQRLVSHIPSSSDVNSNIRTSVADFDGADAFTVDALGIYGPFHALAEYVDFTAESRTNDDQDFEGYAVEAGYFLTGESYKWSKGYNSGVSPKSSFGAWQLVARMESLETEELIGGSVQAGDEVEKFTLGVNWIPRQNVRLMLNYDQITDLKLNGQDVDADPSAVKFRAQAFW